MPSAKPWIIERYALIDEIAERLNVTRNRVSELVESGHIPHIRYEGKVYFPRKEVRDWAMDNLVQVQQGVPLPKKLPIHVTEAITHLHNVPGPLRALDGLEIVEEAARIPAVYFLCHENEVVYVGQSRNVLLRIQAHDDDPDKIFDRAYMIRIPESELLKVEGHFIHLLNPTYNRTNGSRLMSITGENEKLYRN